MKLSLTDSLKPLLDYVYDMALSLVDYIKRDPVGDLTLTEAADLMKDYDEITVAQAERLFPLAEQVLKATTPRKPEIPAGYQRVTDPEKVAAYAKQYGVRPEDAVFAEPIKRDAPLPCTDPNCEVCKAVKKERNASGPYL